MATPAVADIGSTSSVVSCGRPVKRKSVTVGGGDTGVVSAVILPVVANKSVGLVASNSTLPGADTTLTWYSQDANGNNTQVGTTKVTSGTAFQNSLKSEIALNLISKPGETLVVKADQAITLFLSLVQGDRLLPNTP